ncbi:MAG: protein phosphatase 2C domain-containing protein [Candidatus Pseudobacter hemicellulosilyticus]|uniref:Protein phosphatase 2C domain-containing protein n=1 Tax=Candidatus Pseudobacter hemicellulosilyticus TaxID=3121375 RepID=A0AAJ5WMZ3_9BACT|nr:MAG: protein phosphatase 2C domain-containing protein [Pseudobacter sp.]
MLISANTDPGLKRNDNQDAFLARPLWLDKALLAVVDGVGGYAGGDKAAAIARDSIDQYMQSPSGDTHTMLREALVFANNRIWEERQQDHHLREMCCVLTAVVADPVAQCLYFVHIGDTRLYRFRNGHLQKLTSDHSFVGIREDAGNMTELEAMQHPQRHQILREAGSSFHRLDDEDFMDHGRMDLLPGDQLLLCSDGLTDMITAQQIGTILTQPGTPTQKVQDLISRANEMGGLDNITVVLLHQPLAKLSSETPDEYTLTPAAPLPAATVESPAKKKDKKTRLLWLSLPLALIALAGWYFSPASTAPASNSPIPDTSASLSADSSLLPPGARIKQPAIPGPPVPRKTDTLRLSAPLAYRQWRQLADSSGNILVLLPANPNRTRFAAITISAKDSLQPGDTLWLRNLRLNNFETGIAVQAPALLRTDNVQFRNIRYPFSYPAKADSLHAAGLFLNTVNP